MKNLGEDLKKAREEKGLTLSQAAEKTRISRTFLEALENGEYSVIPGEVFVSGFLRSYARELGLREKEVMARYKEAVGQSQSVSTDAPVAASKPAPPAVERKFSLSKAVGIVAVIALLFIIFAVIFSNEESEPQKAEPAAVTNTVPPPEPKPFTELTGLVPEQQLGPEAEQAQEPAPAQIPDNMRAPVKPVEPQKPPEQAKQAVQEKPVKPAEKSVTQLTVKLTARELTWYTYKSDETGKGDVTLRPGESAYIRADKRVVLDLGNAGGVDVELNGKKLPPYGRAGEVVRGIVFTSNKQDVNSKHR